MSFNPIQLRKVNLSIPHKTCFEEFSIAIPYGSRRALIGRNGSGKSRLLTMLKGNLLPISGEIILPDNFIVGYVPQIIEEFDGLSGGERFNKALTKVLSEKPNILLLDEPTNHLDFGNRKSLMRMLDAFKGTLIIASHDVELLRNNVDTFWHIYNGKIYIFKGQYDDYFREISLKRNAIETELSNLNKQKKEMHKSLMKEQERAKKSNERGEKSIRERKWPTIVSDAKASRAIETSGKKKKQIRDKSNELSEQLSELRLPELILPKFSLTTADIGKAILLSIVDGSVGYLENKNLINEINISLRNGDKVALIGDNGSGKSTIVKAILGFSNVIKEGEW